MKLWILFYCRGKAQIQQGAGRLIGGGKQIGCTISCDKIFFQERNKINV
jgi:hypothetical protein